MWFSRPIMCEVDKMAMDVGQIVKSTVGRYCVEQYQAKDGVNFYQYARFASKWFVSKHRLGRNKKRMTIDWLFLPKANRLDRRCTKQLRSIFLLRDIASP